jgi:hypothetical protein
MGSTTRHQSVILYFGDQTEKNIPLEELLEYSKESDRTRQFLQNTFHSIQRVIETLSEPEKSNYKFDSFEEASKRLAADSTPDVVLRTIVLCAAQLGYLIAYARDHGSMNA